MRIVFIGSSKSSKALLEKSIKLNLNIVGICTLKKSFNHDFCDLKKIFSNLKIPKFYSTDINSAASYNWIKNKKPDLIFCFGWSQILEKKIFLLPKIATIGFHPSELPKNRGRHPIIWSLALGLKKTASTFFLINQYKQSNALLLADYFVSSYYVFIFMIVRSLAAFLLLSLFQIKKQLSFFMIFKRGYLYSISVFLFSRLERINAYYLP